MKSVVDGSPIFKIPHRPVRRSEEAEPAPDDLPHPQAADERGRGTHLHVAGPVDVERVVEG